MVFNIHFLGTLRLLSLIAAYRFVMLHNTATTYSNTQSNVHLHQMDPIPIALPTSVVNEDNQPTSAVTIDNPATSVVNKDNHIPPNSDSDTDPFEQITLSYEHIEEYPLHSLHSS